MGWALKKTHNMETQDRRCVVVTYRDPRDVLCSAARRQGGGRDRPMKDIQKLVVAQLEEIFFGSSYDGRWAAKMDAYASAGQVLLLRYEDFVNEVEGLIRGLAAYFGRGQGKHNEELEFIFQDRELAEAWSLRNVTSLLTSGGNGLSSFQDFDPETKLHGHHISNGGVVGGWRNCLTEETRWIIEQRLNGVRTFEQYFIN